jgi:DNA (cytosine-5)-methyltransferase 1
MTSTRPIPIIDLFAGPGGLGEGFASLRDRRGNRVFNIRLSVEMDKHAHRTLTLRSFVRQFDDDAIPKDYYRYLRSQDGLTSQEALFSRFPNQASAATSEALRETLGARNASSITGAIDKALHGLRRRDPWVLIGGPPCQAYSLAGRARMLSTAGKSFYEDHRHTLYKEYLRLIKSHRPTVFVMENVKGLLSSRLNDDLIIQRILADLERPLEGLEYRLMALGTTRSGQLEHQFSPLPADFIIEAERHGIPQTRHRLIIVGVRKADWRETSYPLGSLPCVDPAPDCRAAIADLPPIRSRLSREPDNQELWLRAVQTARGSSWIKELRSVGSRDVASRVEDTLRSLEPPEGGTGGPFVEWQTEPAFRPRWYFDRMLKGVCNHDSRSHIRSDLHRYLFAACFAEERGASPKIRDFPPALYPDHVNIDEAVESRMFNDRFRVQPWNRPATTITSHIHKDGHYFIHPDPLQVRSLTVREAARLQTFPDNYFFEGPRTEQYRQVGNAVPPLLARGIAERVAAALGRCSD